MSQRTPNKGSASMRFAAARYENLSQAGSRHRARSMEYHQRRRIQAARDVVMATPRPAMASTSRTEVKTFDCIVTAPAASIPLVSAAAGGEPTAAFVGITEINDVRQGAAFYNRIGAKIVIKSVELTGEVRYGGGAGFTQGPLR